MRILGIDYGEKKIGLAFGESTAKVASPLEVIARDGAVTAIKQLVETEGIDQIVVGVPLSTGSHHSDQQLKKTRAFIAELREAISVRVDEEDESFTTTESLRLQQEEGVEAPEDALAAMLIVRAYMERVY